MFCFMENNRNYVKELDVSMLTNFIEYTVK